MDSRTITIQLKPLDTVITRPVTQYDRGVELVLTGDDVHYDELSEIHLTRSGMDGAISYPIIPQTDGTGLVYIADSWWEQDTPVTGYVVHVYDASDRITEAEIRIPIRARSQEESITDDETEEARELLNSIRESETNAKKSAEDAEHYAEILKKAQSVLPTVTVTRTQKDDGAVFTVTDTAGNVTETELHDGPIGPTGPAGKDGADGQDGQDGKDGQNGADGKDGENGKDGADGVSPVVTTTQTETGAEITITDKNGQHVVTLLNGAKGADGKDGQDGKDGTNGTNGQDGKDGKDGYTPVRGTDYWTNADKAEIVSDVLAEIPILEEVGV